MAAMRCEQVQRFILERKYFGLGALSDDGDDGDGCECGGGSGNANGDCDKCSSCIRYFH